MTLLKVDELSVKFGSKDDQFLAVDRISYTIDRGEIVGIVGESGSGKSVSSLAIMGLIDYPGKVEANTLGFDDHDLLTISAKEKRNILGDDVAMIFQDPMTSL
ncbi:MAG: ATP-binding cassette domain-containing protein, partial [Wohlfahrtiimonas sp.]